jgi:Transposase DDE domain
LGALVERMTSASEREASPELWAGYEMLGLDATTVSGPGAEGTDARIHATLRLHDLRICEVHVTDASEGETLRRFGWMPGQLAIVDRGYSNAPGILHVVDQGADVLVRLNRGALPIYDDEDVLIDPLAWCRALSGYRVQERVAQIAHGEGRRRRVLRGKLIGVRLPEKEAQEARVRVRREHGPSVTAEQLEAAEYVMLFTTVPSSRLSASRCVEAYRLRWQIELQWKRWKSLCHFDRLPNYRDDTIRSWLTAKVLLGLLLERVGSAGMTSTASPLARQPWKMTAIVWPLIVAALLPMRLAHAAEHLPAIADRLDFLDGEIELAARQITGFRKRYPAIVAETQP